MSAPRTPCGSEAAYSWHRRRGEQPCPEDLAAATRARRERSHRPPAKPRRATGECWCCGTQAPLRSSGKGEGLCDLCACRWSQKGWAGPGPGPEFTPAAERAREYAHVITTLSTWQAAERLGISPRTVVRYRAALREAS